MPRPLPNVNVVFKPLAGGATVTATTDANGSYTIALPPGRYEIVLQPDRRIPYDGPTVVTVLPGRPIRADFAYVNIAV
jgi:Carboxypeptidase regulatory-like domain